MFDIPTVQFALIAILGLACQWTAWRSSIPAILFLLITGIAFGPGLDIIKPDDLLGDLFFPVVSICVALILFEGSLTLNYQEIREQSNIVQKLTSVGMLITWGLITLATHYWMETSWAISFLFGAITVVSGPTVVMPLLNTVRPNKKLGNILRWEGILIDPIGALLAVLVYEFILSASTSAGLSSAILIFTKVVIFGGILGFLSAFCLGTLIRNHWLPGYLHNLATISLVTLVFAGSNAIEHESGLYAVTVMGITLANMKTVAIEEIVSFKEHLSILLISGVFILLAARLDLNDLYALGLPAIGLFICIQFIIRPIMVFACTHNSELHWKEKIILSWIYPRGIVAAAVAALFSLHLESSDIEGASLLVPLTFAIIIGTVTFQSLTAKPLALLLGVAQKKPNGILFVGANQVARKMAKALQNQGFDILLADSNWQHIKRARMENLPTFYGNPVSEYAEMHLDTSNIGHLVASSPLKDLNALACSKFRSEFGRNRLFYLNSSAEARASSKHQVSDSHKGNVLVNEEFSYSLFANELNKEAKLKTTTLTDTYSFEHLMQTQLEQMPLFAIDKKNTLHFFTSNNDIQPKSGWRVCSLLLNIPESED